MRHSRSPLTTEFLSLVRTLLATAVLQFATVSGAADDKGDRPVELARLAEVLTQADRVVVFSGLWSDAKMLFSSSASNDLQELREALAIIPPKHSFHCMCLGSLTVRLYRGETELALVTNHHGNFVRCSVWDSDTALRNPEKWLRWFEARGMSEPRKEVEEAAARARQSSASRARWLAAMPRSIRPLWEAARGEVVPDGASLRAPLAEQFPDVHQRILALFAWYGSGDGRWSGFPAYEVVVENLLLEMPPSDLIGAAQTAGITEAQLEGAARLFGGWSYARRPATEREALPAELKKKLLEHSLRSADGDKIARAKQAFAP